MTMADSEPGRKWDAFDRAIRGMHRSCQVHKPLKEVAKGAESAVEGHAQALHSLFTAQAAGLPGADAIVVPAARLRLEESFIDHVCEVLNLLAAGADNATKHVQFNRAIRELIGDDRKALIELRAKIQEVRTRANWGIRLIRDGQERIATRDGDLGTAPSQLWTLVSQLQETERWTAELLHKMRAALDLADSEDPTPERLADDAFAAATALAESLQVYDDRARRYNSAVAKIAEEDARFSHVPAEWTAARLESVDPSNASVKSAESDAWNAYASCDEAIMRAEALKLKTGVPDLLRVSRELLADAKSTLDAEVGTRLTAMPKIVERARKLAEDWASREFSKPSPVAEVKIADAPKTAKKKRRMSKADRERRIGQIQRKDPTISDRAIAERIGCSPTTVANSETRRRWKKIKANGADADDVLADLKTELELRRDYGDAIFGDRPN